jgi:aminoglycoside phosphotransferase family enzyme/predicted kinase/mono/diheme cytochrome c family protein
VAFLSDPASYPHRPERVERITTHGAFVFLAGSEAYKIKRAVRLPYMDFSTLEKRRQVCQREYELNKPAAPDLYKGVVAITRESDGGLMLAGSGEPVEWVVHMRRFPEAALLSELAAAGRLDDAIITELAAAIARYHDAAVPASEGDGARRVGGTLRRLEQHLQDNSIGDDWSHAAAAWATAAGRALAVVADLLDRRAQAKLVRRCHGDLHLGNIVLLDGRPQLFDALEFDEGLATTDVLYDLAFVLMDLEHRGRRDAANLLLNRYLQTHHEDIAIEGLRGLPLFMSMRAAVRALVARDRALLSDGARRTESEAEARAYLARARELLEPRPAHLIAVGGFSGTGKSTLARHLAPLVGTAPGALHIRSDVERKRMHGLKETERLDPAYYGKDTSARVYAEMLRLAGLALDAGCSVVLDAVYAAAEERAAAEALARQRGAVFTGLWLELDEAAARERVAARRGDASDATPEVVSRQFGYDTGPIRWHRVAAGGTPAQTLALARTMIEQAGLQPTAQSATSSTRPQTSSLNETGNSLMHHMKQSQLWPFLVAMLISALLIAAALADSHDTSILAGRGILEKNCARCHAIDRDGESPLAAAPAFRTLHERYDVEGLAESLAEGIVTGHAEMPQFAFTPEEIGAILAYLRSLESAAGEGLQGGAE